METARICSGCRKPLAPNAPQGLCPECLLKAGLGTGVDIGPDTQSASGRVPFAAPPQQEVAKLFPQLEILGFIGQGGMGAVIGQNALRAYLRKGRWIESLNR